MGPVSAHLEVLAGRPRPSDALLGGVLGEALSIAKQIDEMFFCLEEVMPLLRSLGESPPSGDPDPGPDLAQESREVGARAAELREGIERLVPQLDSGEVLAARLGLPCAILNREVIPLQRVAAAPLEHGATIDDVHYRLCVESSLPFAEFLRVGRQEASRRAHRVLAANPGLTKMATEFLDEARAIVARCQPKKRARYELVYRDRDHQLQHSRGHWILVRGPVARRSGQGRVYVGLPIRGKTREERLRAGPHPASTLAGLWTPRGVPARGGFCMGSGGQYRRLLSPRFSEAEAVVQWLDAGVILATGRSDFHRQWRRRAGRRSVARTSEL
jgi:hypothetical protein